MMQIIIRLFVFITLLTPFESYSDGLLKNAILNQNRKIENIKRDNFRNPYQTLTFFGIDDKKYGTCFPILDISYEREYFLVKDIRLTIDTSIEYDGKAIQKIYHSSLQS